MSAGDDKKAVVVQRRLEPAALLVAVAAVLLALGSAEQLGHRFASAATILVASVTIFTLLGRTDEWRDRIAVALVVGFASGAAAWWPIGVWLADQAYGDVLARENAAALGASCVGVAVALTVLAADTLVRSSPSTRRVLAPAIVLIDREPETADLPEVVLIDEARAIETDDTVTIPRRSLQLEAETEPAAAATLVAFDAEPAPRRAAVWSQAATSVAS